MQLMYPVDLDKNQAIKALEDIRQHCNLPVLDNCLEYLTGVVVGNLMILGRYEKTFALMREGNVSGAKLLVQEHIKYDFCDGALVGAFIAIVEGHFDEALKSCKQVLQDKPSDVIALCLSVFALIENKAFADALEALELLLPHCSKDTLTYLERLKADLCVKTEQYSLAIEIHQRHLRIEQDKGDRDQALQTYMLMGEIYEKMGDMSNAKICYREAKIQDWVNVLDDEL